MKNYLALVLSMTVIASPAFASRARLEALGEGKNGSYYIQDCRNMFLNPSEIVKCKKKMFLELGDETAGGNTTGTDKAITNDRGQGGFTNTFGDFTYGVYMNNDSDKSLQGTATANALNAAIGGSGTGFLAVQNQLEFFFAGEGAMNWGISIFHAGNENKGTYGAVPTGGADKTAYLWGARLGVNSGNFAVFTSLGLAEKMVADNATATLSSENMKGKFSADVAATYNMDQMTAFAKFSTWGFDLNTNVLGTSQATLSNSNTLIGLGAGWKHEMTKSTTMFTRVEADQMSGSTTVPTTIDATQNLALSAGYKVVNIPLVLGAEAQALSWLTVRGSVAGSLWGSAQAGQSRTSLGGTTTVGAGFGMTFGDFQIDGLMQANATGHNPANGAVSGANGNVAGFGTGPQANSNWGLGNNMMSRIAMTYNF